MILPFLGILMVITAAGAVAQSGLLLTWKRLALKPDRLNPVSGFKRMFSGEALTRLAMGLFKVGLLTVIAYMCIRGRILTVLSGGGAHPGGVYVLAAKLIFDLAIQMSLVLLVLGIVDYMLQRWRLERQLRMTKQEVRDELKRMEGDPLLKHRRRQMQAQLAMQRINAEVPRADVVVTNPTEFAVALRYDEANMSAPRVVAKGRELLAQRIRQLAEQHGVPVVQRPPLARALYASVEVGQDVPPQFYRAVAEVLAYVYQLSRRAG
jgi:flagellar biosynthetic protein FlhB